MGLRVDKSKGYKVKGIRMKRNNNKEFLNFPPIKGINFIIDRRYYWLELQKFRYDKNKFNILNDF